MILERIKDFIDTKGISVSAFERSIGMSNASFGKSLKNGGAIGTDKLENILNTYPEINPNWLITGNGSMLKSDEQPLPELKKTNSRHSQGGQLSHSRLWRLHDAALLQWRHHCMPEDSRNPFLSVGWGLCSRHQPGCPRQVHRGVWKKRRLHPLCLREQPLQAVPPPQERHPLPEHNRRSPSFSLILTNAI